MVDEIAAVSAGGMPTRVKCLHALLGHALAAGPGVNPIGDLTLELIAAALAVPVSRRVSVTVSSGGRWPIAGSPRSTAAPTRSGC